MRAGGGRWAAVWAVRGVGALTTAALALGSRPAPASACGASYGYRPTFDFSHGLSGGLDNIFGGQCSGTLSLSASAVAVIAAVVAVTVLASRLLQRGADAAAALTDGPDHTLDTYLGELGLPGRGPRPDQPDRTGHPDTGGAGRDQPV
jgi:hypothetical protein